MCLSDRPTPRQLEALALAGQGLSRSEIGHRMNLSPATIKRHCDACRELLSASNIAHAVVLAISRGYLNIDDDMTVVAEFGTLFAGV